MILQVDIHTIPEGTAILIVGVLALLLAATVVARFRVAGIGWGLTVVALLFGLVYDAGLEWFYLGVILTALLITGVLAVRVLS